MVTAADERRHAPGPDPSWEESWYFDFWADDGRIGGFARLGLRPAERTAWWWTAVVGADRPLVLVRDHDVELPRGDALEIRASGLWAEPVCETPLEHWSLGLEAMAVALDGPAEAYGAEWGAPTPLGLDLEWEALAPPWEGEDGRRYGQPCSVHGEVLVGAERVPVAGSGVREHSWGARDWAGGGWAWVGGLLDDGTPVTTGADARGAAVTTDERGLIAGGALTIDEGEAVRLEPFAHAPVQVPSVDGRTSRLARALCRAEVGDGRRGWAWAERLQPA